MLGRRCRLPCEVRATGHGPRRRRAGGYLKQAPLHPVGGALVLIAEEGYLSRRLGRVRDSTRLFGRASCRRADYGAEIAQGGERPCVLFF